jgi:hypothetical protein
MRTHALSATVTRALWFAPVNPPPFTGPLSHPFPARMRFPSSAPRRICCYCQQLRKSGFHTVGPSLVPNSYTQITLYKKKILRHLKIPAHVWSTKYRWNKKLITQFCCTLRDEHFKPN